MKTTPMYDYEDDRPGRFEGYGQDRRSLYVGVFLLTIVAAALLMDFISRSQVSHTVESSHTVNTAKP